MVLGGGVDVLHRGFDLRVAGELHDDRQGLFLIVHQVADEGVAKAVQMPAIDTGRVPCLSEILRPGGLVEGLEEGLAITVVEQDPLACGLGVVRKRDDPRTVGLGRQASLGVADDRGSAGAERARRGGDRCWLRTARQR